MPLKKLMDTVANTGSKIVAPGSSEAEGLKQKSQNVEEYKSTASAEPSRSPEGTSADAVSPMAKYGDKPGEQRIDTSEMSKPLGGTPVYDCGGMVYDKGGVVGQPAATHVHIHMPSEQPTVHRPVVPMETSTLGSLYGNTIGRIPPERTETPEEKAEREANERNRPHYLPSINPADPNSADIDPAGNPTRIFDDGGKVDVNDGNHQVAILENGERVLTPEQNAQYEAEQAAKAQDPDARVVYPKQLPNPKGMRPLLDTENPPENNHLTGGAKMDISNSKGLGVIPTPASAKMTPLAGGEAQPPAAEAPKIGPPAVSQQKPVSEIPSMAETGKMRPLGGAALPEEVSGVTGVEPKADPNHPFGPQLTKPDEYRQHIMDLKDRMEQGYQEGDLVKAGHAKIALNELKKANPYGTEANHPGILGKIEHGLATAGEIAGGAVAPQIVEAIPGTRANLNAQEAQGAEQVAAGTKESQETAQTALANKQANAPDTIDQQLADAQEAQRINPTPEGEKKVQDLSDIISKGKQQPADKLNQQLLDAETERDTHPKDSPEYAAGDAQVQRIKDAIGAGKEKAPTLEENRLKYEAGLALLDKAGHSTADPKNINKAIDAGLKDNTITADQAAAMHAFQDANSNAATNITLANEKGEGALERNFRNKDVIVQTPTGPMQMTGAEAAAHDYKTFEAMTPAIAQKNKDTNAATVANMKTYSTYQRAANEANLTDEDKRILQMVVEHGAEQGGSTVMNYIPAVGPLSNALNGWLRGGISNEQWSDMTPAAQHLATDYIAAVVGNFAQMKALGILQRNPTMILAEMESIPKPYLPKDAINAKFESKMTETENRAAAIPSISGVESWRDVPRYKPPTEAKPAAGGPPPNTHPVKDAKGTVIGYATPEQRANNTYTPSK